VQKIYKLSVIQPGMARFRSNFVRLWPRNTWCTTNFQGQRFKG